MSDSPGVDPLGRFSDRVGDYVKYRPTYPSALVAFLREHAGLGASMAVADVGSGTGIFTGLLLGTGARVLAVEPNNAMRHAAEQAFGGTANFTSIKGTAEATGLAAQSVSLVTCAQAFHWFKPEEAQREFQRILSPNGLCGLIWNTAVIAASDFAIGYEKLKVEHGTDHNQIRHEDIVKSGRVDLFFGAGKWKRHTFPNHQVLDLTGLRGRLLSSSYAPKKGSPKHEPMMAALDRLFAQTERDGRVRMDYVTELFLGRPL
ncbi:MAG TPA: class I SAM-dependent methyltransferase [Opitutaceae bacterium]